jgi:hypothetical protein
VIAIRAGRQLRISDPQPIVRRVLEVTELLDVLTTPVVQRSRCPPDPNARRGPRRAGLSAVAPPCVAFRR